MQGRNIDRLLIKLIAVGLATVATLPVFAEKADRDQPIHADYDKASVDNKKGQPTIYTLDGDVHITQGTLVVVGDHAVMVQSPDGEQHVTTYGHPATFRERMENGVDWLDGHSDSIEYDSKTGDVKMVGKAWLKRSQDELTGSVVTYNTQTELYTTDGGKGTPLPDGSASKERGHLTIQPKKKPAPGDKPAPAAPAPASTTEQAKP